MTEKKERKTFKSGEYLIIPADLFRQVLARKFEVICDRLEGLALRQPAHPWIAEGRLALEEIKAERNLLERGT